MDDASPVSTTPSEQANVVERAQMLRLDLCERWRSGDRVPVENYLRDFLDETAQGEAAVDLIYQEFLLREELGENPSDDEYASRFPQFAEQLREQIQLHCAMATTNREAPNDGNRPAGIAVALGMDDESLATTDRLSQETASDRPQVHASGRFPVIPGYELKAILGRGGMGVVYKARQVCLDREVALKLIPAGALAGPEELRRFRLEAEAVASLQHSNIVQVYEVGEQDGCPFLALEFVEGGNLAQKVKGTPLLPQTAAQLASQIARAASHAHQRSVIHRDLKPANILLTADGVPKIADFGLAKRVDSDMVHTRSGAVMGTPSYMAPEQAEGRSRDVGAATDVYAIGAILYELLTGRPPFRAATLFETLEQVRLQSPVPPRMFQPKIPRDLEAICMRCLEKEPVRRFHSASELADDLDRFLAGEAIHTRSVNVVERIERLVDRAPVRSRPASAHMYVYLAAAPLFLQLLLFMAAGDKSYYAAASLVVTLFCVALGQSAEFSGTMNRPAGLSAADMRHFWSANAGFVIGCVLLPLVSYVATPAGVSWNPLTVYPLWSVLAGVSCLYLASIIWGRLYLFGVLMFAAAPLMALRLNWAPVIGGLLHTFLLAVSTVHLMRMSPAADSEINNG